MNTSRDRIQKQAISPGFMNMARQVPEAQPGCTPGPAPSLARFGTNVNDGGARGVANPAFNRPSQTPSMPAANPLAGRVGLAATSRSIPNPADYMTADPAGPQTRSVAGSPRLAGPENGTMSLAHERALQHNQMMRSRPPESAVAARPAGRSPFPYREPAPDDGGFSQIPQDFQQRYQRNFAAGRTRMTPAEAANYYRMNYGSPRPLPSSAPQVAAGRPRRYSI